VKVQFTPEADIIVMESYHHDKGNNCALIAVDEIKRKLRLKYTENDVVRRAIELGLTKPRKATLFWTPEEDAFLRENAHFPASEIMRVFNEKFTSKRTLSAIVARIGRLGGVRELSNQTGYTAKALAGHLHISTAMLEKMTQQGAIFGTKRNGRDWYYEKENVQLFIARHPEQIDITKVDKYWLIGILTMGIFDDNSRSRPFVCGNSA